MTVKMPIVTIKPDVRETSLSVDDLGRCSMTFLPLLTMMPFLLPARSEEISRLFYHFAISWHIYQPSARYFESAGNPHQAHAIYAALFSRRIFPINKYRLAQSAHDANKNAKLAAFSKAISSVA